MRLTILRNGELQLLLIRNKLKWTISAISGLQLLQMVSEPDNEQCANKDAKLSRGCIKMKKPFLIDSF